MYVLSIYDELTQCIHWMYIINVFNVYVKCIQCICIQWHIHRMYMSSKLNVFTFSAWSGCKFRFHLEEYARTHAQTREQKWVLDTLSSINFISNATKLVRASFSTWNGCMGLTAACDFLSFSAFLEMSCTWLTPSEPILWLAWYCIGLPVSSLTANRVYPAGLNLFDAATWTIKSIICFLKLYKFNFSYYNVILLHPQNAHNGEELTEIVI